MKFGGIVDIPTGTTTIRFWCNSIKYIMYKSKSPLSVHFLILQSKVIAITLSVFCVSRINIYIHTTQHMEYYREHYINMMLYHEAFMYFLLGEAG